jgi:GNAT superfamily N-acetyltransferase
MKPSDLPAVVAIADVVHPSYPEDTAVLAERLRLYPQGCFAFARDGAVTGYILSHPWRGPPPALNSLLHALPSQPDTYYIHDIALLPTEHRKGTGPAIITTLIAHARQEGFGTLSLVAVNGTAPFWQRFGFAPTADAQMREKLKSYGDGTVFMRAVL